MSKNNDYDQWEDVNNDDELDDDIDEDDKVDNQKQENPQSLEHPDYEELEDKLTKAEQKAHDYWEKLLRMQAEMENLQRRTHRDVEHARKFGSEKILQSLIPVLDSLDQANQLERNAENEAIHKGIDLTIKLMQEILEKNHIKILNPVGEVFNPQEHEAMAMIPTNEHAENAVVSVFQKGYRLHDRIIRPARVTVAKSQ